MSADEKAVWNEQTKLTCTALNNIAVATVVTGVVVPLISGLSQPTFLPLWVRPAAIIWWLGFGMLVHASARQIMRRIKG